MRSSSLPSMIIIFIFDHPAYLWWPPHDPACGRLSLRSSSLLTFGGFHMAWPVNKYSWDLRASLPLVASTWPGLWTTIPEIFQLTFGGLHMTQPVDEYSRDLPAYLWWSAHDPACRWLFPRSSSLPLVASTWPSLRMTSASALFRQMISSSCCWTFFSRQSTRWHSSPWSWLNSPSVTPSRDQRNYKGIKQVSEKFQCGKFCNRTTFIYTAKTTYISKVLKISIIYIKVSMW